MALGAGSIAFVGFNADGNDSLAFVTFEQVSAGMVIHFSDNEWNGSAFASTESVWSWTATTDIAAGTVVVMDGLGAGGTAGANIGNVAFDSEVARDIADANEVVYAYTGNSTDPTFLTALTNGSFGLGAGRGVLTNTGLTNNVNAIVQTGSADVAAYIGDRSSLVSIDEYKKLIFSSSNWARQGANGDQSHDGTNPDTPFSTTPFTANEEAQRIEFSTSSVSVTEGNSGETELTLTLTRTGSTAGAVSFSGSVSLDGSANFLDFGGNAPTFTGSFADGEDTTTITIKLTGDRSFEEDEDFAVVLESVTSGNGKAYAGPVNQVRATILNDDPIQYVGFAQDSLAVAQQEGNDGDVVTFTFVVERSGDLSTEGDVSFSGTIYLNTTDDGDFGGLAPITFSGTIVAGQTSATITVSTTGDIVLEGDEIFNLYLQQVESTGPLTTIVLPSRSAATGIIGNDEPSSIGAGDVITAPMTIGADHHVVVPNGATVSTGSEPAFTWVGADAVLENHGLISADRVLVVEGAAGDLTVINGADGVLDGVIDIDGLQDGSSVTITNAGHMEKMSFGNSSDSAAFTVTNLAGGVITSDVAGILIDASGHLTVNNAGQILTAPGGGGAIDFGGGSNNVLINSGRIEAGAHAATGESDLTVVNEATGVMIGGNGSAVNVDNNASVEETVYVKNYGVMEGRSAGLADSDGDAVDVDGLAVIENWGSIRGLGHNGYHNGEPNVSEGIAIGGGTVINHAGATIYGYGRAIQFDDSGNAGAFGSAVIANDGLIQGDGHLPTGVTPEQVALFAERIQGGEAINIVGNNADILTNTGEIIGGVKMDGGDDTVVNEGTITATGGSAVNLGAGNDIFEAHTGSSVTGLIDGGTGEDVLNLVGTGEGAIGDIASIETINLVGGSWTLGDEGATVVFKDGTQMLAIESSILADGNFAGVISGAGIGDAIDLKGIGLATGVTLGAGNLLTITGGANGPVSLQLDPSQDFSHFKFALAADGAGGTTISLEQKAMGPGSIAFTGFNADGNDSIAFVVLENIAAGTVIHFTDNEWTGSAFNAGESSWSWTATGDIAAGTVVIMDSLASGTASSNLGTIEFTNATQRDIANANETVYAYVGESSAPVFVAAISNDNFTSANGLLTNTGLVQGQTALSLTSLDADADIAVYAGVRGASSFSALLPMINNPANWISQDTAASDENDGTAPDLPLPTGPFVGEPNFQTLNFTGPLTITQAEGDSGVVVFTFTVERSGGTTGAVTFSGSIGGTTNGADFGGTKPLTFSGVIADGATSATVTIQITGDTMLEPTETAILTLTDAHNDNAAVAVGSSATRTASITDSDPYVVVDGQTYTGVVTVPAGEALTVEHGGRIQGDVILNNPGVLPSLTNSGEIISAGQAVVAGTSTAQDFTGGITIVNNAGGLIEGTTRAVRVTADLHGSTFTLINEGTIRSLTTEVVRLDDAINGHFVVENRAGGLIRGESQQNDVLRVGNNTTIINAGTIENALDVPGAGRGGDGIDFKSGTGSSLHNLAGGHIEASRHAVTGERGVSVVNDAGGVIVGRNGSAVNIDNDATVANTVYVTNHGLMQGKSANYEDSDGDAVDVDGLAEISNWGTIEGLGHNGYHDGEPNVSEAIAMGGGTITNYAGAKLYGYGRAIQIDNSSNAGAFAATSITNAGLIQGDGHLPTAVTPEDVALFAERIRGGEAINIEGNFADTLTNDTTGRIIGGVKMGGGDDIIVNKGMMTATGGSAANLGDGNDTFEFHVGSTVTGLIDGGEGDDTLKLIGAGMGSVGANANFEKLDVQSGMWSVQSDAYDVINVATGATVTSQLKLAAEGEMNVAMGGMVIVTNGSDAVVTEGVADIENAGLIQGLGMQGAAMAKAIVTNGGSVHNQVGGTILAMGTAIASGAAPAAGVDIVNEGMIQSMSGQAIALGGQDDSVTNKGMIMGSVDLGAGNDTLNIHTGSSISGTVTGGEGDDTVRLVGTTPSTVGTFNGASVSSFETLAVAEGKWSIEGRAQSFANIVIEDGATVTSDILLEGTDTLKVEHGGKLVMPVFFQDTADSTDVTAIDNAGTISVVYELPEYYGPAVTLNVLSADSKVTLWNREGGTIESNQGAIRVSGRGGGNVEINNAGLIADAGSPPAIHARDFAGMLVLNNLATGVIEGKVDGQFDTINNAGRMEGGFQYNNKPVTVNNLAGGYIEGAGHAVTGKATITVNNAVGGLMVGLNGSAVNIDNRPGVENMAYVNNHGIMEGRSAELSDSDGDAIDTDGLAQVLNYGRIAGLGHQGYHDGDPNISEAIAIGGGTIVNNAGGEIYGYGRAIQVDNSENGPAFAAVTIVNDGLIQGDGHGAEGVDPEDAASIDLRGNEAINIIGDYEDYIINNAGGRIIGGISTGGARDTLNNSGSIVATGGSAINMGAGNDQVNLYTGATVVGAILLGLGDDVALSTSSAGFEIDGGEGNDSIFMDSNYSGDDNLKGGAGDDYVYGGAGNDQIDGGDGNDTLKGESGNDVVDGGAGDDRILAGAGDTIQGGAGDDTIEVSTWDGAPASIDGGVDNDTVKLAGSGTGSLGATTNVENLLVQEGTWSIADGAASFSDITVRDGATVVSTIVLDGGDHLTIENGGSIAVPEDGAGNVALSWTGGNVTVDNAGHLSAFYALSNRGVTAPVTGHLTFNNAATGVVEGDIAFFSLAAGAVVTVNNAGLMTSLDVGYAMEFSDAGGLAAVTFNNLAGGLITNKQANYDVVRASANMAINNSGTIQSTQDAYATNNPGFFATGGDAIDFSSNAGGVVHNYAGGLIEGSRHAITGKRGVTIINDAGASLIGRNGSGINFDNDEREANTVHVTNYGMIEGRSQGYDDSDGDAIDADGLLQLDNYGVIRGVGHNGYHDGEPNVSEGIAVGGGLITNHAGATIYGYGRAIQVDNSENGSAVAATTIVNNGLIQGDGNGPTGVTPEEVALFLERIKGGEAINLVGDWADSLTNGTTGQIIGGVKMGGGNDVLDNSGSITATGGSAIDMGAGLDEVYNNASGHITGSVLTGAGDDTIVNAGTMTGGNGLAVDMGDDGDFFINTRTGVIVGTVAMGAGNDLVTHQGSITVENGVAFDMGDGNDTLNLHDGSVVVGDILLGAGNDVVSSQSVSDLVIDAGNGQDSIATGAGDDIINGGAGIDLIHAGAGEDRIDGGLDNDTLQGGDGDDLILGGDGNDTIDGGNDDDVIYGDAGHDTIIGGLGNDTIKGGDGNDTFVIQATGDGRDSYDGGAGIDTLDYSALNTAVNLTLKDGATTYQTDTIENVENIIGGSAGDKLTGNALDNVLTGNAGDDTLNGGGGNDTLNGGEGVDTLNGGDGNDQLFGGTGDDVLKGAAGDDHLDGGEGNDDLDGGADNDTLHGGAGDDIVKGGAGNDVITGGAGNDTLTGGAGNDLFVFKSVSDGIDTITDFKTSGASEDHIALSSSMFQNFSGDDAFDLIGSGFLRAVSSNGTTQIQVDVDGGGDHFVTLATVTGNISNGVLADHVLVQQDQIA